MFNTGSRPNPHEIGGKIGQLGQESADSSANSNADLEKVGVWVWAFRHTTNINDRII